MAGNTVAGFLFIVGEKNILTERLLLLAEKMLERKTVGDLFSLLLVGKIREPTFNCWCLGDCALENKWYRGCNCSGDGKYESHRLNKKQWASFLRVVKINIWIFFSNHKIFMICVSNFISNLALLVQIYLPLHLLKGACTMLLCILLKKWKKRWKNFYHHSVSLSLFLSLLTFCALCSVLVIVKYISYLKLSYMW